MFEQTSKLTPRYKRKNKSLMNTYDVLGSIKTLTYITGFRVFEYPSGHSRTILSFFYAMLLYSIFVWYYDGFKPRSDDVQDMTVIISNFAAKISQITIFVIIVEGCHQSKSLKLSVRRIHEVDVTLRSLGSPGSFNIIYKKSIAIITFIFFMEGLFILMYFYVFVFLFPTGIRLIEIAFTISSQLYGQLVEFTLVLEFLIIISCIESEFQRMNDLLADINILPFSSIAIELLDGKNSKKKSSLEKSAKLFTLLPSSKRLRLNFQMASHEIIRSRRLLQTIRQVYLELYRVSKRISIIYGMQISVEICLCITYTTYSLYTLYGVYQTECDNDIVLKLSTIGTCMLCLNNWLKVFSINYMCGRTAQQAKRTNELMYTFYGQSTDSELQKEMKMFSLQMMHCQLTYSAAGLYSLNCKNLCACAGFITTYVVIMIQVTESAVAEE